MTIVRSKYTFSNSDYDYIYMFGFFVLPLPFSAHYSILNTPMLTSNDSKDFHSGKNEFVTRYVVRPTYMYA